MYFVVRCSKWLYWLQLLFIIVLVFSLYVHFYVSWIIHQFRIIFSQDLVYSFQALCMYIIVQHKTSFLALFMDNSVLLWISLLNLDNNILWTIRIWLNLLNMVSTDFCIRPQRVIPQCNRRRMNSSLFLISDFLITMAALVTSISLFLPEIPNQYFKPLTKVTSCVLESFAPGPPEPPGSPGT